MYTLAVLVISKHPKLIVHHTRDGIDKVKRILKFNLKVNGTSCLRLIKLGRWIKNIYKKNNILFARAFNEMRRQQASEGADSATSQAIVTYIHMRTKRAKGKECACAFCKLIRW